MEENGRKREKDREREKSVGDTKRRGPMAINRVRVTTDRTGGGGGGGGQKERKSKKREVVEW